MQSIAISILGYLMEGKCQCHRIAKSLPVLHDEVKTINLGGPSNSLRSPKCISFPPI
jgi:hypothetical protein